QPARHVRAHESGCELRGLRLLPSGNADQDDAGALGLRRCPLLAQSGRRTAEFQCPLLGVKRTLGGALEVSCARRLLQDSIAGLDNDALFEQAGTASWARIVWPRSAMV